MNNIARVTRKIFVFIFIAVWVSYALFNMFTRAPYLWVKFEKGWSVASKLENMASAANGGVVFQSWLQEANGYLNNLLKKQTSNNMLIVQGENGHLIYSNFYPYETYTHYNEPALRLKQLDIAAKAQNTSLLFVNCLDLYAEGSGNYGDFPVGNFNPRADAFIYNLQGYGIECLDTRNVWQAASGEYRYKTEPNWTTEAAFEVYLSVLAKLKERGSKIAPDVFFADKANFLEKTYQQSYVGKMGKRTGSLFSGYDDFTLITPAFKTAFSLSYLEKDKKMGKQGSFSSVLLDKNLLDTENIYERDMYGAYLYEAYPFRKIKNLLNTDGPKILIVGDSAMLPISAFLAASAGEVHLFWPYSFHSSQKNLIEYVEDNRIDHIIIGLSPATLYKDGFNFLTGIDLPELDNASGQ